MAELPGSATADLHGPHVRSVGDGEVHFGVVLTPTGDAAIRPLRTIQWMRVDSVFDQACPPVIEQGGLFALQRRLEPKESPKWRFQTGSSAASIVAPA